MHVIRRLTGLVLLALIGTGSLAQGQAQAQSGRNQLYDKLQLNLSGAIVVLGSNIRVDGSGGRGTDINGEEVLGLSRTKLQPRAAIRWRPGRRHELEVGYQFARRTGDKVIDRDIVFADTTFQLGIRVKTKFDADQAFLNYRFAFVAHDRTQVGLGIGVGALFFKTRLDAFAGLGGPGVTFSRAKEFIGPSGSIGLFGRFRLGDDWYLESDLRAIKISIDRIDATVVEANVAARYFVSDKVGFEAGYGISSFKVGIGPKTSGTGLIGLDTSGRVRYSLQNIRLGVLLNP